MRCSGYLKRGYPNQVSDSQLSKDKDDGEVEADVGSGIHKSPDFRMSLKDNLTPQEMGLHAGYVGVIGAGRLIE